MEQFMGAVCRCWELGCASSQTADGDDDAARSQRCCQRDVSGFAHRYNGRCPLHAGVRHALGCALRSVSCRSNAAQTDAQVPSDPQAYCVNHSADFYPYTGEPCKSGYQLGLGNCRKTDGRMVAVPREECAAMAGTVELPFEGGRRPFDGPQAPKLIK